ncbi:hypothetical protein ACED25_23210, partial [Vibrio sp. 1F263]
MAELAETFEVKSIPTLELMKIMHDNGHADIGKIKGIVDYWSAIGDCPANLHRDLICSSRTGHYIKRHFVV